MSVTWQYVIWPNPRSKTRRSDSCENGWFRSLSPPTVQVIKLLMLDYDTPSQFQNAVWIDFWNLSLFGVTWPSKLVCYEESTGNPCMELIYLLSYIDMVLHIRQESLDNWRTSESIRVAWSEATPCTIPGRRNESVLLGSCVCMPTRWK